MATALKNFAIAAFGTPVGIYQGVDEDAAVLAYAHDAGYQLITDAAYIHHSYGLSEKGAAELAEIVADWRAGLDFEEVTAGTLVAVSKASDATWYEVVRTDGASLLVIREAGTDYAEQTIDCSLIAQIKAA